MANGDNTMDSPWYVRFPKRVRGFVGRNPFWTLAGLTVLLICLFGFERSLRIVEARALGEPFTDDLWFSGDELITVHNEGLSIVVAKKQLDVINDPPLRKSVRLKSCSDDPAASAKGNTLTTYCYC